MITLTNQEAGRALEAVAGLGKIVFPGAIALKIRRMHRELEAAIKDVESLRMEALERLGRKQPDGKLAVDAQGMVEFDSLEAKAEANKYLQDLQLATVEIAHALNEADVINKELAPELLVGLGPLLVEEVEECH